MRSDASRIHSYFLGEHADHMQVHDIVHERDGVMWKTKVSSYPKLRLAPAAVAETLRYVGLEPSVAPGARGMVRITALKP